MGMVVEMPSLVEDFSSSTSLQQYHTDEKSLSRTKTQSSIRIQSTTTTTTKTSSLSSTKTSNSQVQSAATSAAAPLSSQHSSSNSRTTVTAAATGKQARRVVTHDYHDHSHEEDGVPPNPVARGGVTTPFPIHWHELLEKIESEGYGHIVSWQPHGRCFVIHNQKEFIEHVMPKYTKHSKFPSFRRQLNLYGYRRLTKGKDRGGYYHELFLRGKPFLARRMQRKCIKGTGVRCRNNPKDEPDFYKMESITAQMRNSTQTHAETQSQPQPQPQPETQPLTHMSLAAQMPVITTRIPPVTASTPFLSQPQMIVSNSLLKLGNVISIPVPSTAAPTTSVATANVVVNFEGMNFHLMDVQSISFDNNSMIATIPSWQEEMELESFLESVVTKQQSIITAPNTSRITPSPSLPPVEVVSDEDDDVKFGELLQRIIA